MTHVISCPVCQYAMKEVEREGVMIDLCLRCKGFWLDHGELEKIMSAYGLDQNRCLIQDNPRKEKQDVLHNSSDYLIDDDDDTRFERGYVPQQRKSHRRIRDKEQESPYSIFPGIF
jgi:Zn-finger nucleic acid-binding protein